MTIGILAANRLSAQNNLLDQKQLMRLEQLCLDLLDDKTLQILKALEMGSLLNLLGKDKKTDGRPTL